jgi:RNase P subunit RPR2
MTEPVVRFPMACPSCGAVCATPSRVSTQADGGTVVIIRCKRCSKESRFEVPATADPAHMRSGVRLPLAKPPKAKES